ncbi:glycerophosphodiester phosphodiesterase [Paenibacillus sacheonensis]|uniref:Glycerophosphodiester phosphodiesterase n=1 Tax=Paenibacillus sacheonensis TaxID=742054 RepID=A0A7X5C0T7_9BACL|nr:glycerophosphodiester phosphodiesterase family protein [Paenibacillus sacheonensis]MBM7565442.1 glycerophosphoryl diester phosphodiesterase [Paenibacillus sacheonensis]NBC69630.1 glycerophosphodiester phosphodiesterase [Paenibacillus sacheonensis]
MINPCVAHRGASGLAPENTMAAFQAALAYPFVQWIELDVQLSKDGIPVVIHDDMLKRTARTSGKVSDYTAEELGRMDAGGWFDKSFAGEGIPTLEQVLDATIGRCRLNIELKTYGGRYPGMERKVVELLYRKGRQHDSVITSFDRGALRQVRELTPDVRTGLIIDALPWTLGNELKQLDASFLSIGYTRISETLLADMHKANVDVMAWTVNDAAMIKRLARLGSSLMICTNYPNRFQDALQSES